MGARPVSVMPFVGNYFLFLHHAADIHPVKIQFKDREIKLKTQDSSSSWHEKIYLSPTILQRKWLDYKFKDRFIPSVKYDNVLPLEMNYTFLKEVGEEETMHIRSTDKFYRDVVVNICNLKGEKIWSEGIQRLSPGADHRLSFSTDTPGVYKIKILTAEQTYCKGDILYYRDKTVLSDDDRSSDAFKRFQSTLERKRDSVALYCALCKSPCMPATPFSTTNYMHKNYIPVKEYLDMEHIGMDTISRFIMGMDHPLNFKRGLVHLLNMLRLASLEDEITIVTNLFKDDPAFAYFITDRLFLFGMIPLMNDRELQNILNHVDDSLLASALIGQSGALMAKVLNNISKRRSQRIRLEMQLKPRGFKGVSARRDIHRFIKSFFEQRYGRGLKIPFGTSLRYSADDLSTYVTGDRFGAIFNHNGNLLFHTGSEIYEVVSRTPSLGSKNRFHSLCMQYEVEFFLTEIFTVNSVTESTVYLTSNFGISSALIHIYNWNDSLEDMEQIENLARSTIIPVPIRSFAVILTIGAIDSRGRINEQVIRILKKGA